MTSLTSETFVVPARPTADGPGMATAQLALANNSQAFLQYATAVAVDFRLGVLRGAANGGALLSPVLTPTTPNLAQEFSTLVTLGSAGTPTTSCLARATESLRASSAWLRPNASLGIVCLQNTLEQATPVSTAAAMQVLQSLHPQRVTVSALAQFEPCAPPDDARLAEAADLSFGATSTVCDLAAPTTAEVARRAFGAADAFVLAQPPQPDAGIVVQVDGVDVPPVNGGTPVWSVEQRRSALVFAPLFVPEPGSRISVQYTSACAP